MSPYLSYPILSIVIYLHLSILFYYILSYLSQNGYTALYYAIEQPKLASTVQALLKRGADPNIKVTQPVRDKQIDK